MEALLAILPVSLSSGVNLYLTMFALGVSMRLGWLTELPGLNWLATTPVLTVAGILFLLEFFADKVPLVDSTWDFFHTFIRPLGALVLALNLVPAGQPELAVAAGLIAGTTALTSHSSKAGFRAMVNTSPEPVSNSVVSIAEDTSVIGMIALVVAFPLVALGVAVVVWVALVVALYYMIRWARSTFRSLGEFFRGKPKRKPHPERIS